MSVSIVVYDTEQPQHANYEAHNLLVKAGPSRKLPSIYPLKIHARWIASRPRWRGLAEGLQETRGGSGGRQHKPLTSMASYVLLIHARYYKLYTV